MAFPGEDKRGSETVEKLTYATLLPIFGRSQGAKRGLDGVAGSPSPRKPQCYGQPWRHREGRKLAQPWWEERVPPLSQRELFGAPRKGEGPLPLTGVAPQLQPLEGMLLRRFTDIFTPKGSRVTCVSSSTVS